MSPCPLPFGNRPKFATSNKGQLLLSDLVWYGIGFPSPSLLCRKLPLTRRVNFMNCYSNQQLLSPSSLSSTLSPLPLLSLPPSLLSLFSLLSLSSPSSLSSTLSPLPLLYLSTFAVGYDPSIAGDKLLESVQHHPPGLIYAPGPQPTTPDGLSKMDDKGAGKDSKKDGKKGRATFSGTQIDELEKAFQATQYLTTAERSDEGDSVSLQLHV